MILFANKRYCNTLIFSMSVMIVHATSPLSACMYICPYNSKIAWWRPRIAGTAQCCRDAAIAEDDQSAAAEVIECFPLTSEMDCSKSNTCLPFVDNVSGLLQVIHCGSPTLLLHMHCNDQQDAK